MNTPVPASSVFSFLCVPLLLLSPLCTGVADVISCYASVPRNFSFESICHGVCLHSRHIYFGKRPFVFWFSFDAKFSFSRARKWIIIYSTRASAHSLNWVPPLPPRPPQASACSPHLGPMGVATLACGKGWRDSIQTTGQTLWYARQQTIYGQEFWNSKKNLLPGRCSKAWTWRTASPASSRCCGTPSTPASTSKAGLQASLTLGIF